MVEEAQDIPLVQAEEEVEEPPPSSGVSEGKESEEKLGGIQAVQEEESDVAIGTERKAEQETVEDQDILLFLRALNYMWVISPLTLTVEGLPKCSMRVELSRW